MATSLMTGSSRYRAGQDSSLTSQQEALMYLAKRKDYTDKLVEKWNARKEGHKLDRLYANNKNKARSVALSLENQAKHLKMIKESGTAISTQFLTTPENVLKIVRIGVANSNRPDIFTEWPLVTVNDALYFVNRTYGTTVRGGVADQLIYEGGAGAANYGTEINKETVGTGTGAATNFTFTLSTFPIVPYTVKLLVGGMYAGTDNGANTIQSTLLNSGLANTVDYTNGQIVLNFTAAPAAGTAIELEYHWNSEVSTLYGGLGDVTLSVNKKNFKPRPYPVTYAYSHMMRLHIETTKLGDVEEMLVRAVGDEHAMRKDYKAFQWAKRVALSNPAVTFSADFAAAGEDNDFNHAQRILTTISNVSGQIYDDIKRGQVNKIVASPIAANYLKKHRLWRSDSSQPRAPGSYKEGVLDGIDVYTTPSDASTVNSTSSSGEMLLCYKNPQEEGEPSIAFGVLTELSAALDYPQLYRQAVLATVEDQMIIQPKFVRLLTINGIT